MPNVGSHKQQRANQKNAEKSTGPRTSEGKARSSANNLRHGFLARDVVLAYGRAAEDPGQFDALLQSFLDDFKPASAIERDLVERLAACCWRSRRAQRFEVCSLLRASQAQSTDADEAQTKLEAQQALLEQNLSALGGLRKIEQSLNYPPDHGEESEFEMFHNNVLEAAKLLEIPSSGVSHEKLLLLVSQKLAERIVNAGLWCGQLESIVQTLRQTVQVHEAQAESGDFPDDRTLKNLIRYESMLDRQFHRALYQLLGRRKNPMRFVLQELCTDAHHETPSLPHARASESLTTVQPDSLSCEEEKTLI